MEGAGTKGKMPDGVPASVQFIAMATKVVKYMLPLQKKILHSPNTEGNEVEQHSG